MNMVNRVMAGAKAVCQRAVKAVKDSAAMVASGAALSLASFSIDVNGLLSSAESIFNGLFPVFAIAIGITIGLGLIALIAREIRKSF